MNRFGRPVLACGLALLLVWLLAALITLPAAATAGPAGPRPAACEPSNEIRVPDDCPTIQAALAVIYDGGQINVRETTDAASTFRENLVITRSVVIYGGWDASFGASDGVSTVDAQRLGRGVTISGTGEIMVVLRAMSIISGTATGLGGLTPSAAFEISEGYTGTTGLAAAAAAPPFRGVAGDDCGGGIYARNAHLRLYDVQVQDSIASTTGRGFGGGVCAVDVPNAKADDVPPPFAPGLRIEEGSQIADNIASTAAEGAGGGVFVVNAIARVAFQSASVTGNLGSAVASAYGGGIFGARLVSYFHGASEVAQNIASRSTDPAHFGRGGGVALVEVTGTTIGGKKFTANVAATGTRGYGGGLYLRQTGDGFELRGTEYTDNRASAAADAVGYGGGLFLEDASNNESNFLRVNTFRGNVAAAGGQGGGGGVFVTKAPELKVLVNQLIGNRAVETAAAGAASFGGGLALVNTSHPLVEDNRIENNVAAAAGVAGAAIHRGGGVFLSQTDELLFGENQVFTNTAAVALPGEGGGLYLADSASSEERPLRILDNVVTANQASQGGGMVIRDAGEALVRHNRFTGNAATGAQSVGANAGGGLLVDQTTGVSLTVTVDRNHFLRNTVGPLGAAGGGAAIIGISNLTLVNNVFAENAGAAAAGLYLAAHPTAQQTNEAANNTFAGNVGPAVGAQGWSGSPFIFHNTIIADSPVGAQIPAGSSATLDYTLWHNVPTRSAGGGAVADLHPVTGDPVFVAAANDDYHVRKTSAARDAGDPAGIPPAPEVDLASAARPFGERVDIGAFEWRAAVHWPNDYTLLQDAIDVALPGDGDTILAVGQGYGQAEEHIRITKSITLSGGWDQEFRRRNPRGPTFWLNQPGVAGRFVTIEGGPGVVVRLEGFSFSSGDASGQGGLPDAAAGAARAHSASPQAAAANAQQQTPVLGAAAAVRDAVTRLGAGGRLPAEAVAAIGTLLDRLAEAAKESAAAQAAAAPQAAAVPQAEADCGGAIYASGAGFYLSESYFEKNIASKTGQGYGGAVCVLDAPAGQLVVQDVEMRYNIASARDIGAGGGLFIVKSPGAELSGLNLYLNVASAQGSEGVGGGLAVNKSDGVSVSDSVFDGNIALGLWGGMAGAGGGAEIWESRGAQITGNTFRGNLGGPMCVTCRGGGLNLGGGVDAHVTGNDFKYNIAGFTEWAVGASGGGLALDALTDSQVLSNTFTSNSAGVGGTAHNFGGGIYGIALSDVLFAGNTLTGNSATQVGAGHGGGALFEPASHAPSEHLTFRDNRFVGNAASLSGSGTQMAGGGGMELFVTTDALIQGNVFDGNRVGEAATGLGGGLLLRSSVGELGGAPTKINTVVDGNLFTGNVADFGESAGGGLAGSGVKEYTVINNVFVGNRSPFGGALSMAVGDSMDGAFTGAVANNTLYNNTENGLFFYGGMQEPFVIANTIVVSHTVGVGLGEDTKIALAYTLWNDVAQRSDQEIEDRQPVTGPVKFVDAAAGNFRLRVDSAARDAGDPAGVPPAPDHDADGAKRPFGAGADIGAYEWHGVQIFMPVITKQSAARVGWAVGEDRNGAATIVGTTDGGRTWRVQKSSPAWVGLDVGDISAVDEQAAWAAMVSAPDAVRDAIVHTTDGGATWTVQPLPAGVKGGVKSIKGLSRTEAWAATLTGAILHTTDGGASWSVVPHPTAPITEVNRMDGTGQHVWIADSDIAGAVVYSHDGGLTWQMGRLTNEGQPDSPLTVHAVSPSVVWASGTESLTFYRSLNGGADWSKAVNVGGFDHLDDICASSAADAWGVTNGGGVDGRIKRVVVPVGGAAQAFDVTPATLSGYMPGGVTCLDNRTAWVVGQQGPNPDPAKPDGVILWTTDGATFTQAVAPSDIHFWKISMAGARR
jgi:hypothetical protein